MRRFLIAAVVGGIAGASLLLATPLANANDRMNWSINLGVPITTYPAYAPIYTPPVVYARTVPVYAEPGPAYYGPSPVVYGAQPYCSRMYYGDYPRPYYWEHGRRMYGHGHDHGGYYRYCR